MSVFATVYHASSFRGLKRIVPSESTQRLSEAASGSGALK